MAFAAVLYAATFLHSDWPRPDEQPAAPIPFGYSFGPLVVSLLRRVAWLKDHPGGLVMVDTLGRYRSLAAGRGNAYMLDLAALEPLQGLAISQHIAIIAAHHDNKRLDVEDWVWGANTMSSSSRSHREPTPGL